MTYDEAAEALRREITIAGGWRFCQGGVDIASDIHAALLEGAHFPGDGMTATEICAFMGIPLRENPTLPDGELVVRPR